MKTIIISLITALLVGFFSLFGRNIIDIAVLKANIDSIECKSSAFSNTLEKLGKNVNDLHWYIITRQKIEVPNDQAIFERTGPKNFEKLNTK